MRPRFSFPSVDVLEHANTIKIELRKVEALFVMEFSISGEVWPDTDDDDDEQADGELAVDSTPDARDVAKSLLAEFCRQKGGR